MFKQSGNNLKAILFDLDGTVLDTRELIYCSLEHVRQKFELPVMSRKDLLSCWGEPLETTMRRWFPDSWQDLLQAYREYMYEHHDEIVKPFDGIVPLLEELQQRKIPAAIVTSKIRRGAERGLKCCGLEAFFQLVVTVEDTPQPKPAADPALLAASGLGIKASEALFVGDTDHDIHCAKAAGCTSVAVGWSDCPREKLEEAEPDYFVKKPWEILEIFLCFKER